jgi:protein subunit release factor B
MRCSQRRYTLTLGSRLEKVGSYTSRSDPNVRSYQREKDHRTGIETGNVNAVMDGDPNQFIEAYLIAGSGATAEKT